ncbi:MAG: hypothetical protein QGG29_00125 [Prochlorococcaceae cyanobacterium ETNP18_MAG_17]|nr:hypothetical protein [Prochlorococcaceae cyanobacterium ETNP18_MAG_17]
MQLSLAMLSWFVCNWIQLFHSLPWLPLYWAGQQNGVIDQQSLNFFRSTVMPALILALFGVALLAVTARIWLPGDMLAPAPIG